MSLIPGGANATPAQVASAGSAGVSSGVTFTQTYSTATATVPAMTSHAGTDSTGGAVQAAGNLAALTQTVAAASVDTSAAAKADVDARLVVLANSLSTLHAEQLLLRADALANRQLINKLIDALQAAAIAG